MALFNNTGNTCFFIKYSLLTCFLCYGWSLSAQQSGNQAALGTEIVHPVDKALMVYVPPGFFTMGMNKEEANKVARQLGYKNYQQLWMWEVFPKRREYTKGFFIDKYEVTIERWKRFLKANPGFKVKQSESSRYLNDPRAKSLPVASVNWNEAQQYANWAGKQLPTEKQWEKAARGTDARLYPWGNKFEMSKGHFKRDDEPGWDGRRIYTRVGRYPAGTAPCGAMDMLGNQYELTSEWLEPYPNNPEYQKMLSYTGHRNVCLRGGSWYHGKASLYAAKRFGFPEDTTYYHVGFRTVWEPPDGYFSSRQFKHDRKAVAQRKKELAEMFKLYDNAERKARQATGDKK